VRIETKFVDLGSADYEAAIRETKALFPDGLCCEANPDLTTEQVPPTAMFCELFHCNVDYRIVIQTIGLFFYISCAGHFFMI